MTADRPARHPDENRATARSGTHRIAIVGANFAGLTAAQHLSARNKVTVIDPSLWFEWLPNIHELVSGVKRPENLRLPLKRLIARTGHRFIHDRVEALQPRAGILSLQSGRRIAFDACIVAVGGVNDTFGVPGADRYAFPFKTVEDCATIGHRLARLTRGEQPVSVIVVGGGLEGVEALGEILRRYRTRRQLRLHLVEAAPTLLPGTPAELDAEVRRHCRRVGVQIHTNTLVTTVTPTGVHLSDGSRLRSHITIWTGGATAPPLLRDAGLSERPKQWAAVAPTLQSRRFANVLVAGDAAALPKSLSKQAYYAMQMGEHAAHNVERLLRGATLLPFVPAAKPMLLAFGDVDTFLVSGNTVVAGSALALVKEAVFQLTLAQIDAPTTTAALSGLVERWSTGLQQIGLPMLTSPAAWLRLPRIRVLT